MNIGDLVQVATCCDNKGLHGKRGIVLAPLDFDAYLVSFNGIRRVMRHYALIRLS